MSTLRQFSEKDRNYFAYQARQNYIRQQNSLYAEKDAANADELVIERDEIAAERDAALAEIESLKALLAEKK